MTPQKMRTRRARYQPGMLGDGKKSEGDAQSVRLIKGAGPVDLTAKSLGAVPERIFEVGEDREEYRLFNDGPDVAYRGGAEVSAATGIPVPVGLLDIEDTAAGGEWWAVSAGTSSIRRLVINKK